VLLNTIARGPDTPPDQPTPDQPTVVFLHGLFGRARNLGFLQRQVARTRQTLALDLRSHGESPHAPLDYPAMAQDVMETLAHHNALPAILIGHSMGGKTAMIAALSHPEQITGLLIADMAPARTGHGQSDFAQDMLRIAFPQSLTRPQAMSLLAEQTESRPIQDLMLQNIRLGETPGWNIGMAEIVNAISIIENWPYVPEGHTYPGPTCFVRGEHSPYVRPEHEPVMRALFPNAQFHTVENAGHWLHVENPPRFTEIMLDFLKTV